MSFEPQKSLTVIFMLIWSLRMEKEKERYERRKMEAGHPAEK